MQRTVKALRILLPIVFVAFVIFIGLSYKKHGKPPKTTADQPVRSPVRPEGKPQMVLDTFEDTQTIGGKIALHIKARRTIGLENGWYTLEDVHLTIYRNGGQTFEVTCEQAQFQRETKQAEIKGKVRLLSSDGMELATEVLKFDGEQLGNSIPVSFKVGAWTGAAGGMHVAVHEQTLELEGGVHASLASSKAGEPPLQVTSKKTVFHRASGEGLFDGGVLIQRAADTLKSDQVKLRVDVQKNFLTALEGDGNVHAVLSRAGGVAGPGAGDTDLTAARYVAEVGPAGAIQAVDIQSEGTPAHATFSGPPQRELTARTLRLGITGNQVTDVRAEGDAVLKELGAAPRYLQANKLSVVLDPNTHQPGSALLEEKLTYRDPKNTATGERATYDVAGDRVVLTAANGSAPTVISDGQSLKATTLEIAPKDGSLKGTGNVVARLVSQKTAASASDTMMFPSSDSPVFVNSDSVTLRQATRVGIFTGNVRAFQETNSLFANELQITGAGDMIQARGNVRTILYNSRPGAAKTPTTAKGDQMIGKKEDRRLDFEGHVQIVDESRTMTSEQASFFFDTKKKLERVEANRALTLVDKATGRKGNGDKAIYRTTQKLISLFGAPAVITDPKGSFQGKEILFDLAKNKVEVASGGTPTQGTYSPH